MGDHGDLRIPLGLEESDRQLEPFRRLVEGGRVVVGLGVDLVSIGI
jgi:hypothetical protein